MNWKFDIVTSAGCCNKFSVSRIAENKRNWNRADLVFQGIPYSVLTARAFSAFQLFFSLLPFFPSVLKRFWVDFHTSFKHFRPNNSNLN